jgi:hypothetical protein
MRGVDGNPVEPCREPGLAAKSRQLSRQGQTDVLGEVLSFGPDSGEPKRKREEPIVVPLQQDGKGTAIAIAGCLGKILIGRFRAHHTT